MKINAWNADFFYKLSKYYKTIKLSHLMVRHILITFEEKKGFSLVFFFKTFFIIHAKILLRFFHNLAEYYSSLLAFFFLQAELWQCSSSYGLIKWDKTQNKTKTIFLLHLHINVHVLANMSIHVPSPRITKQSQTSVRISDHFKIVVFYITKPNHCMKMWVWEALCTKN